MEKDLQSGHLCEIVWSAPSTPGDSWKLRTVWKKIARFADFELYCRRSGCCLRSPGAALPKGSVCTRT